MPEGHEPTLTDGDEQLLQKAGSALVRRVGPVRADAPRALQRAGGIARRRRAIRYGATAFVAAAVVAAIAVPLTLANIPSAGKLFPAHQPTTTTSPSTTTTTSPPATQPKTAAWAVAPTAVDWSAVAFPLHDGCGPSTTVHVVVQQEATMHPANAPTLGLVLVRCAAGAGTPPSALFVYDGAASATSPDYLTTLMGTLPFYQASHFSVTGTTVSITVNGFSTVTSVPNCCPNVHTTLTWTWPGGFKPITAAAVPVVSCPTTTGSNTTTPLSLPKTREVTVPSDLAGSVSFYSDFRGRMMLLAPSGWDCSATLYQDGRVNVSVYPPPETRARIVTARDVTHHPYAASTAQGIRGTGVTAEGGRLEAACALFAAARATFAKAYPKKTNPGETATTCPTRPPTGESVVQVNPDVVEFTDPPHIAGDASPSGGPFTARGAMTFYAGTSPVPVNAESCTLPTFDAQACTLSLTLFVSSYGGQ